MKKIYGIGTGPGASDLLTLRAVNAIKEADIIFAPNNKGKNMSLDTAKEFIGDTKTVLLDFPMGTVKKEDYINAAETIYNSIEEGQIGAFLTIGDSMIYSTFIYIMEILEEKNIEIQIIPGIPSFVAAACASKVPLTVKGDTFLLCDELTDELDKVSSVAVLKTFKNKELLLDKLENRDFIYKYIKRVSLEEEEILESKEEILNDKDYISLILGRKEAANYEK